MLVPCSVAAPWSLGIETIEDNHFGSSVGNEPGNDVAIVT